MSKKQPHKYVDIANLDVERINCFYGSECRLSDVQEWLDELPVVEGLENVTHCSECVFANDRGNGLYDCPKTNSIHKASYYCADGLKLENIPSWRTIYNEPGNDTEQAKFQCPSCRNIYHDVFKKCPACHTMLKIPKLKER
jgi:hypothetical protein